MRAWPSVVALAASVALGLAVPAAARTPPPDAVASSGADGARTARHAPPYAVTGSAQQPPPDDGQGSPPAPLPPIAWARSRAVGQPWAGRLVRGVQLPAEGPDWFTWDTVLDEQPGRGWRRWGTAALIRTTLKVLREYRYDDPLAPRVGIGDLSRPRGGWFGPEYGGMGHNSHQNGLDIDIWYPREDGLERRPFRPGQVDLERSQDLVDRFVAAGAEKVFVGPSLDLTGPRRVVVPLIHHDDHIHVRLRRPPE